ncbi:MAG: MFS transporter [Turicibacter sp.]
MRNLVKNSNFMLIFIGSLVSSIGDVLFSFAIGLYILELTHSAFQLSLYGMVGAITYIILAPFGGVLTDRFSRVKIVYLTDFIRGITMLGCGFVMITTENTLLIMLTLCLTAISISANGALFGPASQSLIPMIVNKDELIHANSLMSLMYNIKDIFGMLLAGLLYALVGPVVIVFVNGCSYLISGLTEMFIRVEEDETSVVQAKQSVFSEMKDGFVYIMTTNKAIIIILVLLNLKNMALGPLQGVLMPYLMNEYIQADQMHLSLLYTFSALGGVAGSLLVSKEIFRKNIYNTLKYSFIILLLTILIQWSGFRLFDLKIIPYISFLVMLSSVFLISGIVGIVFYVPIFTTLQQIINPSYFGRVMSLFTMISCLSMPVSTMIGGVVIDRYGIDFMFAFGTVMMIITLFTLIFGFKNLSFYAKSSE